MNTQQIMTLTEQRLVRMWSATDYGGDWHELNKTLHEIAVVLQIAGLPVADDFAFCASIALQRAVMRSIERKAVAA